MRVVLCTDDDQLRRAFAVRRAVFTDEQGVPESIERDALDASAWHFLLMDGPDAIGAARLVALEGGLAKVGRVAIVAPRRGLGLGRLLMEAIERRAREAGLVRLYLHAQTPVVGFYERLGWQKEGREFFEADIPHYRMSKPL